MAIKPAAKEKNMSNLKNQIPQQDKIERNIRNLFKTDPAPVRDGLTPTQRFVVNDLKELLAKYDGKGKEDFKHLELRHLKGTRAVLLASIVGRAKRFILIGPRGSLQQIGDESEMSQLQLAEAINLLEQQDPEGTS